MTLTYTYDTPHGTLIIAPGRAEDVATLADIGEDVIAWQRSRGIDPGQLPRPLLEIAAARVREGGIYLAALGGEPAGQSADHRRILPCNKKGRPQPPFPGKRVSIRSGRRHRC